MAAKALEREVGQARDPTKEDTRAVGTKEGTKVRTPWKMNGVNGIVGSGESHRASQDC